MPTIFTRLITGEFPSYKVFEDDLTYAFLALGSHTLGHTLIVPKVEIDYFVDLPEPYYTRIFQNAKVLAKAIQEATGCVRVGTMIAGFDVPHFHYHLIPCWQPHDLDASSAREYPAAEMEQMRQKIVAALEEVKS
jgi:histidine triad (HIT) family protein